MNKELIINSLTSEVEIALVENNKLVEIHKQKTSNSFNVGDIYLAKVNKLMPGLNAAFLDIGKRKDAFLHYTDLGPKLPSVIEYTKQILNKTPGYNIHGMDLTKEIQKNGKIQDVMDKKTLLLVQILKEPISTKGPRLSCEITIPGRYLVLTPFSNAVTISKKIVNPDERKRLQVLIESIKPQNFGIIARTAAEGHKVADLHDEITALELKWQTIQDNIDEAKGPRKVLSEADKTTSILRDFLTDDYHHIAVNDKEIYSNIKSFMSNIAPDKLKIVEHYTGKLPIFEHYGINKQIKASFGKTATMNSGAYLVIEGTEAMHVIDVNSGPKMSKSEMNNTALTVNIEAADEICRQLRLRDIGGLIVIDFIDMKNPDHKKALNNRMIELMEKDRAQHTILPLSKFGLMQITRERVRQALTINSDETCPTCNGSGKVQPTILLTDEIERDLIYLLTNKSISKVNLSVHPYVYAYLMKGFINIRVKWYFKHKKWVNIRQNSNFALTEYRFYDVAEDEIRFT